MALRIGILGTRGVPNHYGGFEHIAGYLSRGLVEKGHEVTVYNSSRHPYRQKEWHGVKIAHCFDPEYLIGVPGQFIYDFNCIMDARAKNYDIILMLGYTSSSVWKFLYPQQSIVINNMDGLEWQRTKYSKPVRKFLRYAEKLAVQSSRFHIADSPVIKEYLDTTYHIKSKYIAYGADLHPETDERLLAEYNVAKQDYFLLMARMEPENNIEMILDGFCGTASEKKFIIIGNTANGFGHYLVDKYKNDPRIIFCGGIFNDLKVQTLTAFCSLYFHGHSVGGTNPSLLDAMAIGAPLAAHNNPFNNAILRNNTLLFKNAEEVSHLVNMKQYADNTRISNNYATIKNEFTWEKIIDQYEQYFIECHNAVQQYYPLRHPKNISYKSQY